MNKLLILGISMLVFTTGCLTPAKRLEPAAVEIIKPGQTTRVEVEKEFGKPGTLTTGVEGKSLAQYSYSTGGSYGSPLELRVLSLIYTPHFVVERKLLSEGTLLNTPNFLASIAWVMPSIAKKSFACSSSAPFGTRSSLNSALRLLKN